MIGWLIALLAPSEGAFSRHSDPLIAAIVAAAEGRPAGLWARLTIVSWIAIICEWIRAVQGMGNVL
jgi:hypothetical protein